MNGLTKLQRCILLVIVLIVIASLLCCIRINTYKSDITDEETANLEKLIDNWELCDDSNIDYMGLRLENDTMMQLNHIEVVGEKEINEQQKCYYIIDNAGLIGLDGSGNIVSSGYDSYKPDRYNCETVYVDKINGKETISGMGCAYNDDGSKSEYAAFPWILAHYVELFHPKIDLAEYYDQDRAIIEKMLENN